MQVGRVTKVENQILTVVINRRDMCGDCHACDVVHEAKSSTIQCVNKCEAKVDDFVEVELTDRAFLKATFAMYGIPLVGLIIGLGVGWVLPIAAGVMKDLITIALGLGCLAIVFLLMKQKEKSQFFRKLLPQAVKICDAVSCGHSCANRTPLE